VPHVNVSPLSTSFTIPDDILHPTILQNDQVRLWIFARFAQDELVDESIQKLSESGSVVGAVHDITVVLLVERSLGSELTAEKFGGVSGRTGEGTGNVRHVGDYSLNAIAFAFDLGEEDGHAVFDDQ
jgi:hypothetical protein